MKRRASKPKPVKLGEGYIWFAHVGKPLTRWPDAVQLTEERIPVTPEKVVCLDTCGTGNWERGSLFWLPDPKRGKR